MGQIAHFVMKLEDIQPSQLFISSAKLEQVMQDLDPVTRETLLPLPIKKLGQDVILTDGHTRALAAHLKGWEEIRVYWDEDDLDWEAYAICVQWCREAGIRTIADLADRIVPPEDYQVLWLQRCDRMHRDLAARRGARGKKTRFLCLHTSSHEEMP